LGFGLALAPQQAMAQCAVSPAATPVTGTVTCADTTTTDTTYAGVSPSVHRNYNVDTSAGNVTGTVTAGSVVDGFGLAFTNTVGGNSLNVVNDGTIQIDAGNAATAGGSAALNITGTGATNINYSGTGDILNLGTGGDGLHVDMTGTGNLNATVGGDVTGVLNGINVVGTGTAGDLNITTATGTTVRGSFVGVWAQNNNAASTGDVTITNNAAVGSSGAPGTLAFGVFSNQAGLGDSTVINNGAVGSVTDRTTSTGVGADISNAASTATLSITGTGAIFSGGPGVLAQNAGSGTTFVDYSGAIDSTSTGVEIDSTGGGAVDVTVGSVTTTGGTAVDINQTNAAGAGAISLTTGDLAASTTAIDIDNAGTGAVTVNVDGSITADAGDAVNVSSTNAAAGAISITTLTGETLAASGGDGIEVDTAGTGLVTVTNAADITSGTGGIGTLGDGINVTATGTGGISVDNDGDIGAVGDAATLDGIFAVINNAASPGNVSVTGSGAIFADDEGIEIRTDGTGNVTVDYAGAITSANGEAIEAINDGTGTVSVTTGAGAITTTNDGAIYTRTTTAANTVITGAGAVTGTNGINANSTSGAIGITAGGVVTGTTGYGIGSNTTGLTTITVGANGDVTGATEAILVAGTGNTTITNGGTIGAAPTDLAINVTGGADTTITNQAAGELNGTITLGAADDDVINSGDWNTEGVNDFGGGLDVLTNNATGTIDIGAATSFVGLETLDNAGTVNAALGLTFDAGNTDVTNTGDFNVAGTIDFGGGTDTFDNQTGGVFTLTGDTTLAGLETLTNDGTIALDTFTLTGPAIAFDNTGTITTGGDAGVAGFTTFSNSGTIDLAAGTFTVLPGVPFVNTGTIFATDGDTTITGQSLFDNQGALDLQDGATNDTLTIDSDFVGSGASSLRVDFSAVDSDLLVINGDASGETAIDANYLGGLNLDGVLVVDAVTSDPDAFVLGSVTGETPLVDVSLVQEGADYFLVAAPTPATFNPLAVPAFATSLWYQSADEVLAETRKPVTTTGFSFWGDAYWSRDKFGDDNDTVTVDGIDFDVDNELETKRLGIQMGADYGFGGTARVGLTAGWGRAKADNDNDFTDIGLKAKGWNIGLYGQFGGITGFHGEALIKHDRYDAEFNDGAFDGVDFDIRETGIDGSVGYRFGIGGDANVDINAGVSHVTTKVDDIDAFGFNYDIGKLTSTRGRLGARAVFGGGIAPYVDATVYHEFNGDGDVEFFDGFNAYDVDTSNKGTWVRLEGGLSGNDGPGPILALWGDLGDKTGFGLRAGWRLGGRVAEALPPPPPPVVAPPPPPPPATQTCPDGSVILATDACPPPPPPPPPPPEPERG
jgi:hypothetical protein